MHKAVGMLLILAVAPCIVQASSNGLSTRPAADEALQVACVQIAATADIQTNARAVVAALEEEARRGTRLVAFSECMLTSYDHDRIRAATQQQIDAGLALIRESCQRLDIYAVVGAPYYEYAKRYNGAFVVGPDGSIVKRYAKMHKVEGDLFEEGDALAIFRVDGVPATVMVCHDERYPEIFRIPVLAGAKIGIYISCESKRQSKWDNYRCQIIGRAVENQISIVHCNAGDGGVDGGSHGHSRIIDPSGKVLAEAGTAANEAIRAVIRPKDSRTDHARNGARTPSLKAFWAEGLRVLREQNPEFYAER
ncbi:MAG: hypothetical protein AMXMBFR13_08780 [Phycisphaerae bacterium]